MFGLTILFVGITSYLEWSKITEEKLYSLELVSKLPAYLAPFLYIGAFYGDKIYMLLAFVSSLAIIFTSIKKYNEKKEHLTGSIYSLVGFIYTIVFLGFILKIRLLDHGIEAVFLLILSVFASDTGAFYAGRFFGKNKLMPKVSPKKTIEGFIGGFCLSIVVAVVFKLIFFKELPLLNAFLCGFACGISVPLGDLFESMVKRVFGVKDSGTILPGHGGFLDRVDGLLFASPLVYILITL